ncbi:SRPBCC family protein [Polaribacter sp. Hel1_85]|uniref:SRPBCC family protein n=1 Tax=Polaribacter sp. Hel1_85 TaxID=1250005 RepID=UPI00052B8DB0|nr:SRPBCC domain-containing protein [Polaribacter sp. Hel1_85]KGL58520.1 activator of Hsp90 ATPase 1 family protein [Polaribacter sp. Hel1_85]
MIPIVVKIETNASKEKIWQAITEVNQMTKWFFEKIPDFEAKVGFETSFNVKSTTRDFYHQWKVKEVMLYERISYAWNYKDIIGESLSVFEIEDVDGKSILTISCFGLESLPKNIPEFTRESCLGGWNYFANRLKEYLEK